MTTVEQPPGSRPTTDSHPAETLDESTLGIAPVPSTLRRLRAIDIGVLWGNLAVGVLVLAAGALMVAPVTSFGLGMDLRTALGAMVVGSVAGSLLLALVGLAGHDRGVPTMVLLRPVLGRRGSYVASFINIVQLVGWTSFEFWAMALFAGRVSQKVFGFHAYGLWLVVVAMACTGLAVLGPVRVIRQWLEKAGSWIVLVSCGFLSAYLLTRHGLGHLLSAHRQGAPFAVGVDLVVAQPVSWLPVVADYNRFSSGRRENFLGTFAGYTVGNFWFYALGALLVLTANLTDASPEGIAVSILGLSAGVFIGVLLLVSLLAGETDEAFADIYSAAVSTQNVFPRIPRQAAIIVIGLVSTIIAALVTLGSYQTFLFLLGSVFVPLFAVLLADWLVGGLRGNSSGEEPSLRPGMVLAWAVGFGVYQWIVPTGTMPAWWTRWVSDVLPGTGQHTAWGASLPCFVATFVIASVVGLASRRRRDGNRRPRADLSAR
jgi:NCS1 family nucleobase:cation symporter-1